MYIESHIIYIYNKFYYIAYKNRKVVILMNKILYEYYEILFYIMIIKNYSK